MTLKGRGGLLKNQDELAACKKNKQKQKNTAVFLQRTCQQGDDVNPRRLKMQPFMSIRNPYLQRAPPSRGHPGSE